jgi:hypothetical protein
LSESENPRHPGTAMKGYFARRPRLAVAIVVILCGAALFCRWLWAGSQNQDASVAACVSHGEPAIGSQAVADPIEAAYVFLDTQMDRYHRSTAIYSEPGFSAYYPEGKMGDVDDIVAGSDVLMPDTGRAPLRIDYRPRQSGGQGWAGIYLLYPGGNWGQFPGRNLTGATKLSFWTCAEREMRAEFSIGGIRDPGLPHADSFAKVSTGPLVLTSKWQRHEIDLRGRDLSSVIGALSVVSSRDGDDAPRTFFIDLVTVDLPALDQPRFIQSYYPGSCRDGGLPNRAEIYDQALALLAFLARGRPDDLARAELIARAMIEAQSHDRTFKDGRLRNAYASGELIDPHFGTTRIPGKYDREVGKYLEDENSAGTDTGNMAWAALALVQAHALLPKRPGDPYLNAARTLGKWIIENTKVDDELGGFSAGVQGFEKAAGNPEGQVRKAYRSTEHNIDLEALFERLASIAGPDSPEGLSWMAAAAHARSFVDAMQNKAPDAPYFWTGTAAGTSINETNIPLDVQTWAVLRTRQADKYRGALDWALKNCTAKGSSDTFDFNCNDGDGAWWEGTAQVAAALHWLKRDREVAPVLDRLRGAQLTNGPVPGALPAASRCGLTTGFQQAYLSGKSLPWLYPDWPHIGTTAWFIFATLGVNPFHLADGPKGKP